VAQTKSTVNAEYRQVRGAAIAELHAQGMTVRQIAKRVNCSAPTVSREIEKSLQRSISATPSERELATLTPDPEDEEGTRDHMMLQLRLTGRPYREIAEVAGTNVAEIHRSVMRQLHRVRAAELRDTDLAVVLEAVRLDSIQEAHWEAATTGQNTKSAELILKVMERRSKLVGLDAPVRIDIEDHIRKTATALGLDPDEAVLEAKQIKTGAMAVWSVK